MKAHRLAIAWGLVCNLALAFVWLTVHGAEEGPAQFSGIYLFFFFSIVFMLYELLK